MEVLSFLRSGGITPEGLPDNWPTCLHRALQNLPRGWTREDHANAHCQKVTGNLYSALIHSQKAALFLEKTSAQLEVELKSLAKSQERVADQAKKTLSGAEI